MAVVEADAADFVWSSDAMRRREAAKSSEGQRV